LFYVRFAPKADKQEAIALLESQPLQAVPSFPSFDAAGARAGVRS